MLALDKLVGFLTTTDYEKARAFDQGNSASSLSVWISLHWRYGRVKT